MNSDAARRSGVSVVRARAPTPSSGLSRCSLRTGIINHFKQLYNVGVAQLLPDGHLLGHILQRSAKPPHALTRQSPLVQHLYGVLLRIFILCGQKYLTEPASAQQRAQQAARAQASGQLTDNARGSAPAHYSFTKRLPAEVVPSLAAVDVFTSQSRRRRSGALRKEQGEDDPTAERSVEFTLGGGDRGGSARLRRGPMAAWCADIRPPAAPRQQRSQTGWEQGHEARVLVFVQRFRHGAES